MDLLYQRYASPYLFLDGMIQTGRFDSFVDDFIDIVLKEKEEKVNWEFFLHKVYEGTFAEFTEQLKIDKENANMSARTIETTVQHSMDILNSFNPEQRG